jgi:preprotein translocase subunit YajC
MRRIFDLFIELVVNKVVNFCTLNNPNDRKGGICNVNQLNSLGWILPYIVVIGAFYIFLIRPQKKKEKATQTMRQNVQEGCEIVTIGGIYGKVVNAKEDTLTIEVGSDKVKLKIGRWAVGKVVENKEEK